MALQAILVESGEDGIAMNPCVTISTFGHSRMFGFMAVCTVELLVFAGIGGQGFVQVSMAGAAEFRWSVIRIGDVQRTVWLMALEAVLEFHLLHVRFMTLEAFLDHFMLLRMAMGAVDLSMLARRCLHLFSLVVVAGFAAGRRFGNIGDGQIQWGMRVGMTGEAVRQLEMVSALMTV